MATSVSPPRSGDNATDVVVPGVAVLKRIRLRPSSEIATAGRPPRSFWIASTGGRKPAKQVADQGGGARHEIDAVETGDAADREQRHPGTGQHRTIQGGRVDTCRDVEAIHGGEVHAGRAHRILNAAVGGNSESSTGRWSNPACTAWSRRKRCRRSAGCWFTPHQKSRCLQSAHRRRRRCRCSG